jgi:short-chain fatty acids transporter
MSLEVNDASLLSAIARRSCAWCERWFPDALSLLHWGLSLVFSCLLARAVARRSDLKVDYRAAAAATCTGLGSVWALGLSSSAAQLQANPASMPPALLAETGVIPFSQTIFLWQSMLCALVLVTTSTWIAWKTAPGDAQAQTAEHLGVDTAVISRTASRAGRPGEWLEHSPLPALFIVLLGVAFLVREIVAKGAVTAISSLNTYNFIFILAGLLLQWRPRRFVEAVARSVPGIAGVLIQFPLFGAISAILTGWLKRRMSCMRRTSCITTWAGWCRSTMRPRHCPI